MTHAGIECFLAICRHRTVVAAAQGLYITQPSLSARLKVLEREVGTPLFYRRKGSREMELTPAGKEFYQLAVEYETLMKKMRNLGSSQKTTLQISCFNSLGTYLLPAVYRLFLQTAPGIRLQMQDMEMAAASQSILRGETDLAFVAGHISDSHLRQIPAFSGAGAGHRAGRLRRLPEGPGPAVGGCLFHSAGGLYPHPAKLRPAAGAGAGGVSCGVYLPVV